MNKLFVFIFLISGIKVFSQEKSMLEEPIVDKRVELLSIVFRLAESQEYSANDFKKYADEIETYFGKYKNH